VWIVISGHEDIPGNEEVEGDAKKGAQSGGTISTPFAHPYSMTRDIIKKEWTKLWEEGKYAKQLRAICKRPHVESGPKLYNQISARKQLAVLVRVPTQHRGLNQHLHRFNIKNDPHCPYGEGMETVEHFLLLCNIYEIDRGLKKEVGAGGTKVEKLLMHPKKIN
jgi:hypothetical protein